MRILRLASDHCEHYVLRHYVLPFFALTKNVDRRYTVNGYMYLEALAPHLLSEAQRVALRDPVRVGITRARMIGSRPHAAQASPRGSASGSGAAPASTGQPETQTDQPSSQQNAGQETTTSAEEWSGARWAADQGRWSHGRWQQYDDDREWHDQRRDNRWWN